MFTKIILPIKHTKLTNGHGVFKDYIYYSSDSTVLFIHEYRIRSHAISSCHILFVGDFSVSCCYFQV